MDCRLENLTPVEIEELEEEGIYMLPKTKKTILQKLESYKDHTDNLDDLYDLYKKKQE